MSHLASLTLVAGALTESGAVASEILAPECVVDQYLGTQEAASRVSSRVEAYQKMTELFAVDAQYVHASVRAEISGRENILASFRHFSGSSRNIRFEVHDFFSNANAVSISLTRHFERLDADKWVKDSARQMMVFEMDGGRIKTVRDYWVAGNKNR